MILLNHKRAMCGIAPPSTEHSLSFAKVQIRRRSTQLTVNVAASHCTALYSTTTSRDRWVHLISLNITDLESSSYYVKEADGCLNLCSTCEWPGWVNTRAVWFRCNLQMTSCYLTCVRLNLTNYDGWHHLHEAACLVALPVDFLLYVLPSS